MSPAELNRAPETPGRSASEHADLLKWQRRLLPFTTRFLVIIAIAYFALSVFEVYEMQRVVRDDTAGKVRAEIETMANAGMATPTAEPAEIVWRSLLLMEADAMDKRYRQASALLMSRIWTKQLSFVTGMVLAFIGALFILSKLSEGRTDVNIGAHDWKAGISSASPGLVLAFFGTTLIAIGLVYQPRIEVQDRPIYFGQMALATNPEAPKGTTQLPARNLPPPADPFGHKPQEPSK